MKPDNRVRACAAGALWGTVIALVQAAFSRDPFASLTAHTVVLCIVLSALWVIDGKLRRRAVEKERRSCSH